MRTRRPLAAALICLVGLAQPVLARPASAQDDTSSAKRKLDAVLAVLRGHQDAAGKPCLEAMTRVHQTEDQVGSLGQQDSSSNHPDSGADVARDVLESDYETAQTACQPDATRACAAHPDEKSCAKLNGSSP